jgi:hypothetical protein
MGKGIEPVLQEALDKASSAEVRHRLEQVLQKLKSAPASPEALRTVRAVEVLERARTPEARRVLEKVARAAPGSPLAQEAKAALGRLGAPE